MKSIIEFINEVKRLPKFRIFESRSFHRFNGKPFAKPIYNVYRKYLFVTYEYEASFDSLEDANAYIDAMNEILQFKDRAL